MAQSEKNPNKVIGIIKYVSGLLGFLGIVLAILTVIGVVDWYLLKVGAPFKFDQQTKLILSLVSSIAGIFFLFVAFSRQIDNFFNLLESHAIKTDKAEDTKGITLESIFFFLIGVALVTLAVLLAIGSLIIKSEFLGPQTKNILIAALILLSILAFLTAFNETITQALKEMKKVTWPKGHEMLDWSTKVFSFIVFFSLLFLGLDILLTNIPHLVERVFHVTF